VDGQQRAERPYLLAATNHLWDVDPALLRPGRLDRSVLVLPPDQPAREAILRLHLRGRPVEPIDVRRVAAATEGFSGVAIGVVLAIVLVAALWGFLWYYPRWRARRWMSGGARIVLERDRQLRRR
jgi:SpoVK/Ycf46/Vps4 family AAA+-type ATPase